MVLVTVLELPLEADKRVVGRFVTGDFNGVSSSRGRFSADRFITGHFVQDFRGVEQSTTTLQQTVVDFCRRLKTCLFRMSYPHYR